jgi:hypothetical protein
VNDGHAHHRTRIGPWRLLDIVQASMSMRGATMVGAGSMPEYGPPDAVVAMGDPDSELPDSNISDGEQRQAVERERSRRWMRDRRSGLSTEDTEGHR